MKKHILTAVILTSLSVHTFALPQNNPQPLLGEMQDSNVKTLMGLGNNLQTEGGAERTHERQMDRLRVAEGGADRVHQRQMDRLRLAEGGAERLSERQQQLKRTS